MSSYTPSHPVTDNFNLTLCYLKSWLFVNIHIIIKQQSLYGKTTASIRDTTTVEVFSKHTPHTGIGVTGLSELCILHVVAQEACTEPVTQHQELWWHWQHTGLHTVPVYVPGLWHEHMGSRMHLLASQDVIGCVKSKSTCISNQWTDAFWLISDTQN